MKYKKLKGICKVAIETGMCLGCSRLELERFEGVTECKYMLKRKNSMWGNYGTNKNRREFIDKWKY